MTTIELRNKFNDEFRLGEWPRTYKVDAETYGNVAQSIFNYACGDHKFEGNIGIYIVLGPNRGLMFKDVELILEV